MTVYKLTSLTLVRIQSQSSNLRSLLSFEIEILNLRVLIESVTSQRGHTSCHVTEILLRLLISVSNNMTAIKSCLCSQSSNRNSRASAKCLWGSHDMLAMKRRHTSKLKSVSLTSFFENPSWMSRVVTGRERQRRDGVFTRVCEIHACVFCTVALENVPKLSWEEWKRWCRRFWMVVNIKFIYMSCFKTKVQHERVEPKPNYYLHLVDRIVERLT